MKTHRLHHVSFYLILIIALSLTNCKQEKPIPEVQPSDQVMAAFSQSPPVFSDISIEKLDKEDKQGNTIALTVRLAIEEKRMAGINSLPLSLDEKTKVTLNDRGVEGDRKANDSIFSVALKVSDQQLTELANRNNESLAKQKNTIVTFNGRIASMKEVRNLDMELLKKKGGRIPFGNLLLSRVTKTTMPELRDKSLMITDLSVVNDITRTYEPCSTTKVGNPDKFLFDLQTLPSTDATTLRTASKTRLIRAWMRNSGATITGSGIPTNWKTSGLKAQEFPVRLLAIINRLDLRGNSGYGGKINDAGEGRFVFSFVDGCNTDPQNGPGTMTFILEYGIPITQCQALVDFGKKWWDLQSMPFDATFNQKLEEITTVFTVKDADGSKPNGSALNHFRSNDFLNPLFTTALLTPWVIRDFEIDASTGKLKIIHPSREPMESANGFGVINIPINNSKLASLVAFANTLPFTPANLNPTYDIPDETKGIHAPMRVLPNPPSTLSLGRRREQCHHSVYQKRILFQRM